MKKKLSFVLFFILIIINPLSAQKGFGLSVSAGPAIPVGKFSGKDIFDLSESFAKTGIGFNAAIEYNLSDRFGFELSYFERRHQVNTISIAGQLQHIANYGTFQFNSGVYEFENFLGGIHSFLPIDRRKRFLLSCRLLAGITELLAPQQTTVQYIQYSGGASETGRYLKGIKGGITPSFTYLMGIGFRLRLKKSIYMQATIDYSGENLKYQAYPYSFEKGNDTDEVNTPAQPFIPVAGINPVYINHPLNSLNAGFGLEFRF